MESPLSLLAWFFEAVKSGGSSDRLLWLLSLGHLQLRMDFGLQELQNYG